MNLDQIKAEHKAGAISIEALKDLEKKTTDRQSKCAIDRVIKFWDVDDVMLYGDVDRFDKLKKYLPYHINLEYLGLLDMGFSEVPKEVLSCTSLNNLVITNSRITEIPNDIIKLDQLQEIDLSFNEIGSIETSLFSLPKLRRLNLYRNKIKHVEIPVDGHLSLEDLNLDLNQLESIPDNIEKLSGLKSLSLYSNKITEMSINLKRFPLLRFLAINMNPISKIEWQNLQSDSLSELRLPTESKHLLRIHSCLKGSGPSNNIESLVEWM